MAQDNGYEESVSVFRGITFGFILSAGCWAVIAGVIFLISKFI